MSKWRPTPLNCIYIIPDIHGSISCLNLILDRILPLRKSDGGKDRLIFLGDYIDRHTSSPAVIDKCIELEAKYGDQVIFLLGNHELMLLQALNCVPEQTMTLQTQMSMFNLWIENGGRETVIGYLDRAGATDQTLPPRNRLRSLIPEEHIAFFQRLKKYHEIDQYVFVHAGLDPTKSPEEQQLEVLVWDRSLVKYVLEAIKVNGVLPWERIVVCGHSTLGTGKPIIKENYLMLDCGSPHQLLVLELESMTAYMADPKKDRLVKFDIEETIPIPSKYKKIKKIES